MKKKAGEGPMPGGGGGGGGGGVVDDKRPRTAFTTEQLNKLRGEFQVNVVFLQDTFKNVHFSFNYIFP